MDMRHGASPTIATAVLANKPLVFSKMESLVREMQIPDSGIPIGDQKIFLTSIPSVFMGYDLIEWLIDRLEIEDSAEAIHLGNLLCQYGYFFPVGETRSLIVKDDSSLYRFQTPYYWPSQNQNADTTDYAIYLSKRLARNKQKHGLEDYEMEAYNKLKKGLQHKWDFIVMQAEEQVRLAKDRKKGDKIVTDSQERAYWRVYRPPPGYINSLENAPIPDRNNMANRVKKKTIDSCKKEIELVSKQIERTRIKGSLAAEALINQVETYLEYDYFLVIPLPTNPWITEDITYWMLNESIVEVATEKRVKRWGISCDDLVSDPTGLNEFTIYLRKEYSHENIRFWQAVMDLRYGVASEVVDKVKKVYEEFLKPGAPCEINIDGKTMEVTQQMMKQPSRYTYDLAAEHVYLLLLKKDCYPRFLRSEHYKNLQANAIQPLQKKRFFSFGPGKKKAITMPNSASLQAQTPQPLKRLGSDEQNEPAQGLLPGAPKPHMGISAALGVFQPKVDCDPPYSLKDRSSVLASGEPMSEVCPWESDNVCPWEFTSMPQQAQARTFQQPHPLSIRQHQQSLHSSLPSKQQHQLVKPMVDRSKSVDVNTLQSQRPQSASFVPSLVPIRGTSPSDGSPVRGEKAKSVDVCPWESQPSTKNVTTSSILLKESTLSTLVPTSTGSSQCVLTERRASEGVLRLSLGVCPWDEVLSVQAKSEEDLEKENEAKESTSIRIKILDSGEEESTEEALESTVKNLDLTKIRISAAPDDTETTSSTEPLTSTNSPKSADAEKKSRQCTAVIPYLSPDKKPLQSTNEPKKESTSVSGESFVKGEGEHWEDSQLQKTTEVCPWEDEDGCKVEAPYVKRYTTFGYL